MPKARTVFLLVVGLIAILGFAGICFNKQFPLDKEERDVVFVVSICFLVLAVVAGSITLRSSDEAFEDSDY